MGIEGQTAWRENAPADTELVKAKLDQVIGQIEDLKRSFDAEPGELSSGRRIRRLLKIRRARSQFFGPDLFADPAWDILLQAYAADLDQERFSISAMTHAAAVPTTTALRWIKTLEKYGLLVRRDGPLDGRRSWIELSADGRKRMVDYLASISDAWLPL